MKLYQEIYCGIYRLCFRKVDIGNYSATILLSVLLTLNLITFSGVLQLIGFVERNFLSRTAGVVITAIIITFNMYYFNFSKRDRRLINNTSKQMGYLGDVYAVIYAVVSIVIFLKVASLVREENAKLTNTLFITFKNKSA
jgi:fucose 4-O-acetylase-like acetyltransferase